MRTGGAGAAESGYARSREPGASRVIAAARRARVRALAGFSKFRVGAALELADGRIVSGCNIENATYGLTMCAERVAMFKALSEGHRRFRRIAVVADTDAPTPPCGACRQILWEFGGDIEVVLANLERQTGSHRLSELLPLPFDARLLGGTKDTNGIGTKDMKGLGTKDTKERAGVSHEEHERRRLTKRPPTRTRRDTANTR